MGRIDIDGFFKRYGTSVLTFEVKVGGKVEQIDFSKEFILGEDRNDPFAIQQRLDEASSLVAFYGTLHNVSRRELKDLTEKYDRWYAAAYKQVKARLILEISNREMAAGLKKAPTESEVEIEVSLDANFMADYAKHKAVMVAAEEKAENMKLLFDCAKIDADQAKSAAYLEDTMLKAGLLETGPRKPSVPQAQTPNKEKPAQPKSSDEEF